RDQCGESVAAVTLHAAYPDHAILPRPYGDDFDDDVRVGRRGVPRDGLALSQVQTVVGAERLAGSVDDRPLLGGHDVEYCGTPRFALAGAAAGNAAIAELVQPGEHASDASLGERDAVLGRKLHLGADLLVAI